MTREQVHEVQQLADLISLEDDTIEDSPETDALIVTFENGGEL